MVQPGGPKIFSNGLQGAAKHLRDPVKVRSARRSSRPQIEQWLNTGHGSPARNGVWHKRCRCLVQALAQSLVVAEQKGLVSPDRASKRAAKLVALERRSRGLVKIIGFVESVIT